ncbi:MAG TPA: MerR family transcriptional regulator [Thermoanaerobaculia bacterium]|jgi:DNA-binding transcriptional MerR regulator|nr:MerR family transcriptional regulator [Thermoanaerobaculia bacterium]
MTEVAEDKRLYKIGEVCRIADVQPYVLRYWETEFAALAPNKSGGGQRLYTQREIDIILRIKQLLYSEGFTIAGAKKKLEAEQASPEPVATVGAPPPAQVPRSARDDKARAALVDVKRELTAILDLLSE